MAQKGQLSILEFSLQGVTIIVLIGLFLVVCFNLLDRLDETPVLPNPAKQAIKKFYRELNFGIESYGTPKGQDGFTKSWNLLTPQYQAELTILLNRKL